MQVLVNGKEHDTAIAGTIQDLLKELGYSNGSVAVALEGEFLPKRLYATTKLEEKMDVEILMPMQGG